MNLALLRRTTRLFVLIILALGVSVVSAQDDALDRLEDALEQSGSADTVAFEFDLSFTLGGIPGTTDDNPNRISVTGVGSAGFEAIDLTLNGSIVDSNGEAPFALWGRVIDGFLYFSQDGSAWTGLDLAEIAPLVEGFAVSNFRSGFAEGVGASSTTADLAADEAVDALLDVLMGFDIESYLTTTHVDEDSGLPVAHDLTTIDIPGIANSEAMLDLVMALVQIGDPTMAASVTPMEMSFVSRTIAEIFQNSSLTVDSYVNTDTGYLDRAVVNLNLNISPESVETTTGDAIVAALTFDLRLFDYDVAPAVAAPPNAMILRDVAGVLGLNAGPTPPPFQVGGPTAVPTETSDSGALRAIQANTPVTVTLSGGPAEVLYQATAGETVTVTARSLEDTGSLDTTLEILSPSGARVDFNDDHGSDLPNLFLFDSALQDVVLPEAGMYVLRVSTFSGAGNGDVELTVTSGAATAQLPTAVPTEAAVPTVAAVQAGVTTIAPNTPVIVDVSPDGPTDLMYSAQPGETITVIARSVPPGSIDTTLEVISPLFTSLATNDDHASNLPDMSPFDSAIRDLQLENGSIHTIRVSTFAGSGTGQVEVTVQSGAAPVQQPTVVPAAVTVTPAVVGGNQLVANTPTVVTLSGEPVDLTYTAAAAETVTITVRSVVSSAVDTTLEVRSPEGTVLNSNDDHNTDLPNLALFDSALQNLSLPSAGTYIIRAGSYANAGTGDVEVTVSTGAVQQPTAVPSVPTVAPVLTDNQIVANMPTVVSLPAGFVDLTYNAAAGETITVTARSVTSGAVDTTLEIRDASGGALAVNDDHASDLPNLAQYDSAIRDFIVPAAGVYTIRVDSFGGSTSGDVEVTVTSSAAQQPTLPPAAPTVAPVVTGNQLSGNTPLAVPLSATGPTELAYTGTAGETITVIARSLEAAGAIDTTLEVLAPNGTRLGYNDDHGSDLPNLAPFDSAVRELVLPETGVYTVRVTTFSGAGEGSVEITAQSDLAPAQVTTPVPGVTVTPDIRLTGETDTVRGEVPAGSAFTFNFNGRANEVTTITAIAGTTGDLDPRVALIGPDGAVLAENDDHTDADSNLGSLDSRISGFILPANGTYSIIVSGFANTSGAFVLTVERAVEGGLSIVTPVAPVSTPTASGEEQVIAAQIRANDTYTYELQGNAGDVYSIVVRGQGNLDPRLIISDPDGFVIAENDDHRSSDRSLNPLDSKIDSIILQETGTYTLEVTDYSGNAGSFELAITLLMTGAPLGPGVDDVSLGQTTQNEVYTMTVDLNAGDFVTVTIRTVSGDLDPVVSLLGPSGSLVAENDDHTDFDSTLGRYDSRIQRMLISETGTYTIEVTGYSGSGTFTVTLNTLR